MERKCANCANNKWSDGKSPITDVCIQCRYVSVNGRQQPSNWKPQPTTNGDRIRAMNDDELADYLAELGSEANNGVIYSDRPEEWLEWIKQPAEVE